MEYKVKTQRLIFSSDNFSIVAGKDLIEDKSVKLEFHENNIPVYATLKIDGELKGSGKFKNTIVVKSFDFFLSNNKMDMLSYLSQPDFKGVGRKTAQKIIDAYEDYLVNGKEIDTEIVGNPEPLIKLLGYSRAMKYRDTLISKSDEKKLNKKFVDLGIDEKFLTKLRNRKMSENEIIKILNGNLYEWSFNNDNLNFSFRYIDEIVYKMNKPLYEKEHYKWVILGDLKAYFAHTGNTWVSVNVFGNQEMKQMPKKTFERNVVALANQKAIKLTDDNTRLTFASFYYKERENAEILARNSLPLKHNYSDETIDKAIQQAEKNIEYNFHYDPEQRQAIKTMMNSKLMILQGKPGTGKSKVVQGMVKTYLQLTKTGTFQDYDSVTLLAPTGKASTRLNEIDNSFNASTIHSFLHIDPFESQKILTPEEEAKQIQPCGLVIVDEASMLDVFTLNMLLTRISFDKLVFVGDINQLPSVNVGDTLWDMEDSHVITSAKLKKVHRASEGSGIISLANAIADNEIHNGKDIEAIDGIYDKLDLNVPDVVAEEVQKLIKSNYDLDDYQFLAPMYKTTYGITWLNSFIQKKYHKIPDNIDNKHIENWVIGYKNGNETIAVGDKVLFTKNNPDYKTTNGETGRVEELQFDETTNKFKSMIIYSFVKKDYIEFKDANIFDELTLGYAVSVHKSQGSEYKKVFVVFDTDGKDFLDKRNIYTAITRSKDEIYLIGNSKDVVNSIKRQPHKRNTYMLEMIKSAKQYIDKENESRNKPIHTKQGEMTEEEVFALLFS